MAKPRKAEVPPDPTPAPALPPEREKDPAAVALGRKGGMKGRPARDAKMSKDELVESARNVANTRWGNKPRHDFKPEG